MCRLFLMTIACLLILFGISGLVMMPKLIQNKIEQRMQLKIGTKAFDRFTKVPIPLTVKFYLFNITNSEQVLAGLERPHFKEIGPFMYKQWRRREIVDFEDYNRKLRYREIKTFYPMFSPQQQQQQQPKQQQPLDNSRHNSDNNINNIYNKSPNSNDHQVLLPLADDDKQAMNKHEDNNLHNNNINSNPKTATAQQPPSPATTMLDPHSVNVTIINLPLLSALTKLAQMEEGSLKRSLAAKVASRLIADGKEKILVNRPVNQLLFDGYRVGFMESARDLFSSTLGFNFESPLPNNKFGFFYMKNGTWNRRENGELTVFTGRNDSMNDFMIVDNWNDQRQLSVWPTNTPARDRCNQIRGTDGSQFHPGVTKHQVLSIFSPMVCTSLFIRYKEDTQAKDIPLLRFSTPAELFGAPKKNPENACYCTISNNHQRQNSAGTSGGGLVSPQSTTRRGINDSRCYLDGLMDLSLCQRGAPIAASSPHFYNADPMLAMAAGLKPDKELHETYIDIEPMTGSVFRAASRAQLNAYVEQAALDVVDTAIIGNMTHMVAPLLWLEESAEIDEKSSIEFKGQLLNLVQRGRKSFIYSIIVGIILALVVSVQYWYVTCHSIDITKVKKDKESKTKKATGGYRNRARKGGDSNASQLQANLRLSTGGARRSNAAASGRGGKAKDKSMLLKPQEVEADSSSSGLISPGAGLIVAAAVLGAASAGPSSAASEARKAAKDAGRRRVGARRVPAPYQPGDDADDDELSKRMLVNDEWELDANTTNTPTTGSSSGGDQAELTEEHTKDEEIDLIRPSTSSAGSVL